jgi:putative acetyltransferase
MRLDTVPAMTAAITLYTSLGFVDIPAYRENPIEGARYRAAGQPFAPTP